jgi:protoheme IX farnesyltransferase
MKPASASAGLWTAAAPAHTAARASALRHYVALTKPRIISLLLLTTVAAMFVASQGWPGTGLLAAVIVGGYLAAGAANTINMLMDRDIDARMARTSGRPLVTQVVTTRQAVGFAAVQACVSFALLWWTANLLTAVLAMSGLAYYVVIYTLWLKRRSRHNIVIGGAAGAVPPLVGWAAVHGDLGALAWVLFAVIFVWTPVHFWALAIVIKDDYAGVGVPMLPVVGGNRATARQITGYAVATALCSGAPLALGEASVLYAAAVVWLNWSLAARTASLLRQADGPSARRLFKFSLAYLALLFLALAVDRGIAPRANAGNPEARANAHVAVGAAPVTRDAASRDVAGRSGAPASETS